MHLPLFQDIQGVLDELEPTGSEESGDVPRLGLRGEAPPAWKVKSCVFMVDQSANRVAAACSRKALSYASQTRPLNWWEIHKINNLYKVKSFQRWGKNDVRTSEYTVKASVQVVISSIRRRGFFGGADKTKRPSSINWGSVSELTKFAAKSSDKTTNFPPRICVTSLAGTGE